MAEQLNLAELPVRDHMNDPSTVWRHGKPNFTNVDMKYLREKSQHWPVGSLEKIVENIVKTVEMESSHKPLAKDWKSVDITQYRTVVNGKRFDIQQLIDDGTYNVFLYDNLLYDAHKVSNQESHDLFRGCFTDGFAWELLELQSGPPRISFTWRHWGHFKGPYGANSPTGEICEMIGFSVALVNDKLQLEELQIWYDPYPVLATLTKLAEMKPCGSKCPFAVINVPKKK